MCGIWCIVCFSKNIPDCNSDFEDVMEFHKRRGPDVSSSYEAILDSARIHLSGHVLWTQGPSPVPQPQVKDDCSLLFNGDIYSTIGGKDYDDELFVPSKCNDGMKLFSLFSKCKNDTEMTSVISQLRGPFAFIYLNNLQQELWFGRDFFGRQSLIFSFDEALTTYHISSVSLARTTFEVPSSGIYKWEIISRKIYFFPYISHERIEVSKNLKDFSQFLSEKCGLIPDFEEINFTSSISLSFCTKLNPEMDEHSQIFQNLLQLSHERDLTSSQLLLKASEILEPFVTKFLTHLRRSVRLRLKAVAPYCRNCVNERKECDHVKIGVLFSGGLDSTVIAYLAAEYLNNLDLLNVSFSKSGDFNTAPDRITALESFKMLQNIFDKGKQIKLVLCNITKDLVVGMRRDRIKTLIAPLKSVIDDSVGCCLWFASRARDQQGYQSPIRTVLIGSGADELLGGYSRHRSSFQKHGWTGLTSEMQFDLDRISFRNMGRDNRIISDHGLSPRIPFLDEGLVHFLTQECPTWVKCCPFLGEGERGIGEKILLRAAAVKLFGPENVKVALFPKRAMQFGSRIAKLENSKEKGADSCDRLL